MRALPGWCISMGCADLIELCSHRTDVEAVYCVPRRDCVSCICSIWRNDRRLKWNVKQVIDRGMKTLEKRGKKCGGAMKRSEEPLKNDYWQVINRRMKTFILHCFAIKKLFDYFVWSKNVTEMYSVISSVSMYCLLSISFQFPYFFQWINVDCQRKSKVQPIKSCVGLSLSKSFFLIWTTTLSTQKWLYLHN